MRYRMYATSIASVLLFARIIASPIEQTREQGLAKSKSVIRPVVSMTKYFQEPGRTQQLSHYDARFFRGIVSDEERTTSQVHMIRAYLSFFQEQALDTWLAHGTLLGWWWNGKRLPWDSDIDVQVSSMTLQYLGDKHNHTIHKFVSEDGLTRREYLLDVNPWIWERMRGDGMNVIDARWIDVRNGLFIDITGLTETHPDTKPGIWSCKNYHRYKTSELYPMRETTFEGVVAKVPYAYDKILIDEYAAKALVVTEFEGHTWVPERKEWIKTQANSQAQISRGEYGTVAKQQERSR